MASNELEPLLKALVALARDIAARQKALEAVLTDKGIMSVQEWKTALNEARIPTGPSQSAIKKVPDVANYLETLTKH